MKKIDNFKNIFTTKTNKTMKNLTKLFLAVSVALFSFACATDMTEDLGVKVGGKTVLSVSTPDADEAGCNTLVY